MSPLDVVLLLLIAAIIGLAVWAIRHGKCGGCHRGCHGCTKCNESKSKKK